MKSGETLQLALGLREAAQAVGLSKRTIEAAVKHSDPARRLRTYRYNSRRLVRPADLEDWVDRVMRPDESPTAEKTEPQAA